MTSPHNIATLLEERLPAQVWRLLQRAGDVADDAGIPLYLVGGTVRDALLGQPTWDVDLVVEGTAQSFAAALGETVGGRIVSHSQFGTVQLRAEELRVDIAASRQERYARPGALPIVSPGTLAEDLHRRDFSINAIAVALNKERWSQVLDPEVGWADIQAKRVRVLHEGSFQDDPTRVLRALRYSVRLGFAVEAATERALRRDAHYLAVVSAARRWKELERVLQEPAPEHVLLRGQELGVLPYLHPALNVSPAQVAACALAREQRGAGAVDPLLYACLLTYELSLAERTALVQALRPPRRVARALEDLGALREAEQPLASAEVTAAEAAALLRERSPVAVQAVALMAGDARARERARRYLAEWRHLRPRLSARALRELGVPEGPAVGRCLGMLLAARLNEQTWSVADEQALVRQWLAEAK